MDGRLRDREPSGALMYVRIYMCMCGAAFSLRSAAAAAAACVHCSRYLMHAHSSIFRGGNPPLFPAKALKERLGFLRCGVVRSKHNCLLSVGMIYRAR